MATLAGQPTAPTVTQRYAITYRVTGDQRFLSHQDELRALSRAVIRARWPLAFSQGFNPQPKLSIALPRPLGVASECQLALVGTRPETTGWQPSAEDLSAALPTGFTLGELRGPLAKGTPLPERAHYVVTLATGDEVGLGDRIATVLQQDTLPVERVFGPGKPRRQVDVRPHLAAIKLDGNRLHFGVQFIDSRAARPAEVLDVLGIDSTRYRHLIRLTEVEWIQMPGLSADARLDEEGLNLGNDEENHP